MSVTITKLPPGKAVGADDLRDWGKRRLAGRAGVPVERFWKIAGPGPACPRCGQATQTRERIKVGWKQKQAPFYYARWFVCVNDACETTQIMRDEDRVWNDNAAARRYRRLQERWAKQREYERMMGERVPRDLDPQIVAQLTPPGCDQPPWEDI